MSDLAIIRQSIPPHLRTPLVESVCRQRVVWALCTTVRPELGDIAVCDVFADDELLEALTWQAGQRAIEFAKSAGMELVDLLRLVLQGAKGDWTYACLLLWPDMLDGATAGAWQF